MGLLLMLMSIGGIVLAMILLTVSFFTGSAWLRNFTLGSVAIWFVFYFTVLVGTSFASSEKTLAINEPKEFCGFYLDCHMHTAVTGVRTATSLGSLMAKGKFYIVTVKVFSDAKRATLGLLAVDAQIQDDFGNRYDRDLFAEAQLPPQPQFEKRISPDETVEKEIVFDLPAGVKHPLLDMREGYGIDHAIEAVLIGDEDSILHKRVYFGLQEQVNTASVK
jgi:hypothetical protein